MIIFHICMIDCGFGNVQFVLKLSLQVFAVADIKTEFCSYSYSN